MNIRRIFTRLFLLLLLIGAVLAGSYLWWYVDYQSKPVMKPLNAEYQSQVYLPEKHLGLELEYFNFNGWDGETVPALIVTKGPEDSSRQLNVIGEMDEQAKLEAKKVHYVLISVEWDHGILSALPLAETLTAAGYRCVLWESRGADNARAYCTHGLKESADVPLLIDALSQRDGKENLICLALGQGYGAAMLLQAAPLDGRIRGVVSIDSYSSLSKSLQATLPDNHLSMVMLWLMDRRISSIVGYECFDVAPVEHISRLNEDVPLLLINLTQDSEVVSVDDAINLFWQASSLRKQVWALRDARDDAQSKTRMIKSPSDRNKEAEEIQLKSSSDEALLDMLRWLQTDFIEAIQAPGSLQPQRPDFIKSSIS